MQGGTHFYLEKLDIEPGLAPRPYHVHRASPLHVERTYARYAVYRIEPAAWPKLDAKYRPAP